MAFQFRKEFQFVRCDEYKEAARNRADEDEEQGKVSEMLLLFDILAGLSFVYCLRAYLKGRTNFPLPPGPLGWPILGNASELFHKRQHLHWSQYKQLYGPITHLSALGKSFMIINDQKVALELLDKRSTIYSNRPEFHFANL